MEGAIRDLAGMPSRLHPPQSMYWQARRLKGRCHLKLEEFDKAALEFKFFHSQFWTTPTTVGAKRALFNYGRALMETGIRGIIAFRRIIDG